MLGDGIGLDDVTKHTGLKPSKAWLAGENVPGSIVKSRENGWVYSLSEQESYDIAPLLEEMVIHLKPGREKILEPSNRHSMCVEICCHVSVSDGFPAMYLDNELINKISSYGASLDIDLIGCGLE